MTLIVTQSSMNFSGTAATNNTVFREFVTKMTDMFSLAGWVNTNASGSIDPTTVSAVGAASIAGYQVWRFNDTLHNNGYPVFVKVEYGSPGTAPTAGVWLSVGFMHNGSGSINATGTNGVGSTPRGVGCYAVGDVSVKRVIRMSCISGSDMVTMFGEYDISLTSTNNAVFAVERTKGANGNSTNEGVIVFYSSGHNSSFRSSHMLYSYNTASYTPTEETFPNYILSNGHAIYNTDVTLGMLIPILSSSFGYPSRMLGIVNGSSFVQNTTHIMTLFGTSSLYLIPGAEGVQTGANRGRLDGTGNFRWILRYE